MHHEGLVVAYTWNLEKQMFVALGKEFDMVIFGAGFPGSRAIQSAHVDPKFAGMPLGRGADLSVRDNAALHAKSLLTICMSKCILIKYYTTKQKG